MTTTPGRKWLCEGCHFLPQEGVVDGIVACKASGNTVTAVLYSVVSLYEACPYRQNPHVTRGFLPLLARRARALSAELGRSPNREEMEQLEAEVARELETS